MAGCIRLLQSCAGVVEQPIIAPCCAVHAVLQVTLSSDGSASCQKVSRPVGIPPTVSLSKQMAAGALPPLPMLGGDGTGGEAGKENRGQAANQPSTAGGRAAGGAAAAASPAAAVAEEGALPRCAEEGGNSHCVECHWACQCLPAGYSCYACCAAA